MMKLLKSIKTIYILIAVVAVLAVVTLIVEINAFSAKTGSNAVIATDAPTGEDVQLQSEPTVPTEAPTEATQPTEAPSLGWQLTLVNADHPINPDDLPDEFTTLRNEVQIDDRIYEDLQDMFDDARYDDVYPVVNEGFRSSERQQEILDEYIAAYMADGNDEETARQMALTTVALPGTSEHELGLALDIVADEGSTDEEVYAWLADNAWNYGFILRYPEGKEDITGISYEPWHYRYVGKEAAKSIRRTGETLEEYVARLLKGN